MHADGIRPRGHHNGAQRVIAAFAAVTVLLSPFVNAQAASALPETIATATGSDVIVLPGRCVPGEGLVEATPDDLPSATASPSAMASSAPTPAVDGPDEPAEAPSADAAPAPTGTATSGLTVRNGDIVTEATSPSATSETSASAPTPTATTDPAATPQPATATATPAPVPSPSATEVPAQHPSATPTVQESATPSASPSPSATDDPTAASAAGCAGTPAGVSAEAGRNAATIRWASIDDTTVDGAQPLVAPTAFYVVVEPTDPTQASAIGRKVVQVAALLNGLPLDGVTVTGLRNGVKYAFTAYAATAGGTSAPAEQVTATPTTGTEGEVAGILVKFADDAVLPTAADAGVPVPGAEAVTAVGLALGGEVAPEVRTVDLTEPVTSAQAESIAAAIAADPAVEWAEPDQFVFTAAAGASDDIPSIAPLAGADYAPGSWQLWDEHGTGAAPSDPNLTPTATSPGRYAGSGQVVAVIDTGITDHPALLGATVPGYDFVSDPAGLAAARDGSGTPAAFDADGTPGRDDDPTDPGDWSDATPARGSSWHGTAVAGVIAAQPGNTGGIAGTAPGARVEPIRALSWRGGLISDIAAGITWASGGAVDGTPGNANPAGVINLSLAVQASCPATLQAAIDGAVARGSVVVAAAGNADDDAANWAPANCANVITVGATGRDGHRAGYSNWGQTVDLSAPGGALGGDGGILTTSNDGARQASTPAYRAVEGTSIAAAQVAAAAALVRAGDPGLSPEQVYTRLTGKTTGFADGTFDPSDAAKTGGAGIVDLSLAQIQGFCGAPNESSTYLGLKLIKFTTVGTCDYVMKAGVGTIKGMLVGGGGGGGGHIGGGGGGGGVVDITIAETVVPGNTYEVQVGAGGTGGQWTSSSSNTMPTNGGVSKFEAFSDYARGGGRGGNFNEASCSSGSVNSSGGGGGGFNSGMYLGCSGSSYGYKGGNAASSDVAGNATGGGGGAGGPGSDRSGKQAGAGGPGKSSSVTGLLVGGGGGGGARGAMGGTAGSGGSGGGGSGVANASNAGSGTANTGGGGGGTGRATDDGASLGGSGGSGIVVLAYNPLPERPVVTAEAGEHKLLLSWTPPVHTGGQDLTGYTVTASTTSNGTFAAPTAGTCTTVGASATSCEITGIDGATLAPNTTYYAKIAAVNASGSSPYTSAVSAKAYGPQAGWRIGLSPFGGGTADTAVSGTFTAGTPVNLYLRAVDTYGNTHTGISGPLSLTSGAFTGSLDVTMANGIIDPMPFTPTKTGSNLTLGLTANTFSVTSGTFTVKAGPASAATSTISSSAASLTADGTSTSTVTVQLKDQYGNNLAVSGGTVTMSTSAGTLSSVTNKNDGTYTATLTAPTTAGTATISATLGGVALTNGATVALEPGAATKLVLTRSSAGTASGAAFTTQPKVSVTDANGNVLSSATNTVTATITAGAGGSLVGTTSATAVNGVAEFTDLGLSGVAGTAYTIRYETSGLTPVTQTVTSTVGAATKLAVSTMAMSAVYDTLFGTQPVVIIQDSGNNTVASATDVVTATVKDSNGTVVNASTTTATAVAGTATFSGMKISEDEGQYTIEFSATGLTGASQYLTLTTKAQTITFGALADKTYGDAQFSVSASASSALDVEFESRTTTVCSTSGTNNREVSILRTGTCTIRAKQAGNGRWSAAASVDRSFVVAPAAQATLSMSSPATVVYGSTLTLATTGGSGDGTLTFVRDSGTCTVSGTTLTPGDAGSVCTVKATKDASTNYLAATSAVQTITITKATQTVSFTSTVPSTPVYSDTYTPAASSTSGLPVTISIDPAATSICSLSNGVVTFDNTGSCVILASQGGGTNYQPATDAKQTIAVGAHNQSITFPQPNDMVILSANQSMTATADSTLAVEYAVGPGTTNGACTVTQFGVVAAVAVGVCEIVANQPGDSNWAPASPVTRTFDVTATIPTAPKIDSVSAGNGSLTVGFTAPGFNGGIAIKAYRLTAYPPVPGAPVSTSACSPTATPLACTLTGLTNGTAYSVKLAAVNEQGDSPSATVAGTFTPVTAAYAVGTLVATPGDTVLDVSWAAPVSLGGGTFVRYELYLTTAGTPYPTTPTATVTNAATLSHQFTGLSNGTSYDVKIVTITTANGSEIPGNTADVRQYPSTVPSAPATVSILALTATTIQVSWSAPISDGGAPLVSPYYAVTVTSTTPNANTPLTCVLVGAPGSRECEITGMTNGAIYTIAVTAQNRMGIGASKSTAYTVPGSDSLLRSVVLTQAQSGGAVETLDPTFDPGTFAYTATVPNAVTDVTVTPAVRETGATVQVNGVTVASGIASAAIPLSVGANTITFDVAAHDPTFTSQYTLTVTRMPAADLARIDVSSAAASITANGTSTTTVTVALKDATGAAITRTGGTVALATDRGTLGAVTDNGDGTYTATLTSSTAAGSATVSATLGGQAVVDTAVVAFTPGTADVTTSTITPAASSITANGTSTTTVTVRLKDQFGNFLTASAGVVTMATNRGTLSAVTDNADGTYTATLTSSTTIGAATLTAKLAGVSLSQSASVTFVSGVPSTSKSTLTVGASTLTADGADSTTVTVALRDAFNNAISAGGENVQILASAGTVSSVTDIGDGTYTATLTAPTLVGSGTVSAKVGGQALTSTFLVDYVPGAADATRSVVVALPTTTVADGQTVVNVTVQARDAHGNNLRTGGSTVVLDVPSGISLIGSVLDKGDGTYTQQLTAPLVVGQVTIGATLDTVVVGTSATVDFTTGNPTTADSQLTVGASSLTADGTSTSAVTVTLKDAYGHTVVDPTRLVVIQTSAGTVGATTDNGDGTYSATVTAPTTSGLATVSATLDGTTLATTRTITFTPGAASLATTTITVSPTTLTADGTSTADVEVIVRDANSNVLTGPGGTLALSVTTGMGTISTPAYVGSGVWTATYTAGTVKGTATVSGTLDGSALTDTATVTLTPDVASLTKSVVSAGPTSITADGTSTSTITVTLKDAHDNVLDSAGGTVSLSTDYGTLGQETYAGNGVWQAVLTSSTTTATATVTAALNGNPVVDDAAVAFVPGAADVTTTDVAVSAASITADGTSTSTVTVALVDAFGNALTASGGTVVVATDLGTVSAVTDNADGTYTATLTAATTVGTATVTATLGGTPITDDATVVFVPGAADAGTSALSVSSASITANGTSTSTVTVTLKDAHSNLLTAGGDTVAMATSHGTLGSVTDNGDGTYTATLTSATTVGTAAVTATVNTATITATAAVAFVPGAATLADSTIDTDATAITADGVSTATITVTLKDAHGNTLTASGGTVAIATDLGTIGATTDNGDGTYTATLTAPASVGTATVSATLGGSPLVATTSVAFISGSASITRSTVTAAPTTVTANGTSTSTVTVALIDGTGNALTASGGTVVVYTSAGTVGATTDNGDGTYTATLTSPTTAGSATLTAKLDGVLLSKTATVAFVPGAASTSTSTLTSTLASLVANGTASTTVTVKLYDAHNNALTASGGVVTLAATRGTLSTVTDNANGTYTATYTTDTLASPVTITAELDGSPLTATRALTLMPGPAVAAQTALSASAASLTANGTDTATVTVTAKDANGNALITGGSTVVVSTTRGTVSAVTDNGDGTYTATLTSGTVAGLASLTATLDGTTVGGTDTVDLTPDVVSAAHSTISVLPGTVVADGLSTATVTVTAKDVNDNTLRAGGSTVVVTLPAGGGTVGAVTDNGDGTYTATVTAPLLVVTATVSATIDGSALGATETITFVAGAPDPATTVVAAGAATITADGTSTTPVTVTLKDVNGNIVTTGTWTVALATTAGSLGTVTRQSDGTYSATLTSATTAGSATVSGTLNAVAIVDTAVVGFVPGAATTTTSTVGVATATLTANGTATTTVTVTLKDAHSNFLTASGGTVAVSTTAGTLGAVTDNADGTYTATLTAPTTAGSATVSATLDGNAVTDTASVSFVPGAASTATSTVTTAAATLTADGTSSTTVTVTLKDAHGNTLTSGGATVVLSTTAGTLGSLADNGDGTYAATLTAGTTATSATVSAALGGSAVTSTATVSLVPGAASTATSTVSAAATTVVADGSTTTVTVALKDAHGNALTASGGTVVVSTTAGTVGTTTDNGDGTYTATLTAPNAAGSGVVSATLGGNAIASTVSMTFVPGGPSLSTTTVTASAPSVIANGTSTSTVTVTLKDANANALTASSGVVLLSTTAGTLSAATDNGNGTYTATLTAPTVAGSATVSGTLDGNALSATATVAFVPGPATTSKSTVAVAAGTLTANGTDTTTVTVTLKDAHDNVLTAGGATVVVSTDRGTVGATTDNGDGTYTATLTASTVASTATVSATLSGAAIASTATVALRAGAPVVTKSVVDVSSASITADGASTSTVTVTLKDAYDNVLDRNQGAVVVTTTAGTVSTAAYTTGGQWTATLTAPTTAGSATVKATLDGTDIVSTATVAFVPGAADTSLTTVTTAAVSIVANGTDTTTVTVQLKDAFGNALTSNGGVVALSTTAGTITATAYSGNGQWTATLTAPTTTGTATVSATLGGSAVTSTATVSLVPGAATQVAVHRGAAGVAAGAAFTTQPRVAVQDANGNVRTSDNATVVTAAVSSGATLVGTTAATAVNGLATFVDLGLTGTVGTAYTVTYSASGLTAATEQVTAAVGAPVAVEVVTAASGAVRGADFTTQPVVRIVDAGGNTVTTDTSTVTASVIRSGLIVNSATATAVNGVATFSGMRMNVAGTFDLAYAVTGLTTANHSLTVAKGPQTITFAALATRTYGDPAFTVSATSDSGLTVAFASTTTAVCTTSGTNGSVVTILAAGTCTVRATQAGDDDYLAATAVDRSFTVDKKAQPALTMTSASTVAFGGSIVLAATGGEGTGDVSFAVQSGSTCTIATTGSGSSAVTTLTPGAAGSACAVTATKDGDANLLPVTSTAQTITVTKAGQQLAFTSAVPTQPLPDGHYTPTVSVTSLVTGQASGLSAQIAVTTGSPSVCTIGGGVVSFVASGTCEITASQTGNGNFDAATSQTQTIVVGSLNQTITFPALADASLGDPDVQASATASSNLAPAYTLGAGTTNSACTVTPLGLIHIAAVGTCEVTASQPGNAKYAAASDVTRAFVVHPGVPTAPVNLAVTADNAAATVSFTAPSFDGGAPITGYVITATPASGPAVTYSACTVTSPCTIPGLVNGRTYSVVIAAVNTAGTGAASNALSVMPYSNPQAVTQLAALPGDGTIDVTWQAPVDLGGGTFVEYRVFVRPTGFGAYPSTPFATIATPGSGHVQLTGLTNGDSYDVKVVAFADLGGTVFEGLPAEITEFASGPPSMPRNLTLQAGAALYVSWAVPLSDGGAPITGYDISVTTSTPNSSLNPFVFVTPTSGYVPSITPGANYIVHVAAVNRSGLSIAAMASKVAPTPTPAALVNSVEGASSVSSGWDGYRPPVAAALSSVGVWQGDRPAEFSASPNADSTGLVVIGSAYRLEVGAVDATGKPTHVLTGGTLSAGPGSLIDVGGVGYVPGERLLVRLIPLQSSRLSALGHIVERTTTRSYALGDVSVFADGSFGARVRVPDDTETGHYALEIVGPSKAADDQTVSIALLVNAQAQSTAPRAMVQRIAFKRLSILFDPAGVAAIRRVAASIPAGATDVRIQVVSRWGEWDPAGRIARIRAQRVVDYLRETRGINAAYRQSLPKSVPAQVLKLGGVSVTVTYTPASR